DIESSTLNLSFVNCMSIILIFLSNICAIMDVYCYLKDIDDSKITPSDYTLMISNITTNLKSKDDIIDFLNIEDKKVVEVIDDHGQITYKVEEVELKPKDIIMTYKIYDLLKMKNKLLEVCKKLRYCKLNNFEN